MPLNKVVYGRNHGYSDRDYYTTDVSKASATYPYIQILASHGITTGSNGQFMPLQPVSRQHFVLFLTRTLAAVE